MKIGVSLVFGLASAVATFLPLEALAVDYGPRITPIWGVNGAGTGRGMGRIDIDDLTAGQETFAAGWKVSTVDPDGPGGDGDVQAEISFKTGIHDINGTLMATLAPMKVRSRPYPDPCVADNQRGGSNQTSYDNNWIDVEAEPGAGCEFNREEVASFYADQGMLNAAIGNSAEERTLVFGLSVVGEYYTPSTDGVVSVFRFFSFDADNHDLLCQLWFAGVDGKDRWLDREFSGVGPYLGGDDVLRVAYTKDGWSEGQLVWNHTYYDIRTCETVKNVWATSPKP